jgi:hypothetical protein
VSFHPRVLQKKRTGKTMIRKAILVATMLLAAVPASAQLGLPPIGDTLGRVGGVLGETLEPVDRTVRSVTRLARDRVERLTRIVRENRDTIDFDEDRQPAVRGVAILLEPDPAAIEAARAGGYDLIESAEVEGLGIAYARLSVPPDRSLAKGIRELRKLLPGKTISADQLHFTSGSAVLAPAAAASATTVRLPRGGTVGVIDGGIASGPRIAARRGFAEGAPKQHDHAQSIASLLAGAGVDRIWSADVYGSDPAGGNALAIAQAVGWMAAREVPVVSISLVGPSNPLLRMTIAAAQRKGMVVVAAVGNDGSAAPPAYPASYPGVIAVTGVDGKGRVLLEAGKASHLDYAAPGADLSAVTSGGKRVSLRGTSFAAPLAAARIAAHRRSGKTGSALIAAVDSEAADLGKKGPDSRYGRGVLCQSCRKGI